MAIERILVDRKSIQTLYQQYLRGQLILQPFYQRGKVWQDDMKMGLIESINLDYPIGLVICNVVQRPDADGTARNSYEVVDGQQRLTTLFEYLDGSEPWASNPRAPSGGYTVFRQLTAAKQERFEDYQVPMAFLHEFEEEDITEVFSRLQMGKPLKMGEKLKALTTGASYEAVRQVADHELFELAPGLKLRANNWTLASTFMKIAASRNPLVRVEFPQMKEFITAKHEQPALNRTLEDCRKTMSFLRRTIKEAEGLDPNSNFLSMASAPRTLKWLFAALTSLGREYSLTGKETAIAQAVTDYYEAVKVPQSVEWTNYLQTGRTGRLDNEWVQHCIEQLSKRIITHAELQPVDPNRNFTASQRAEIFLRSGGKCKVCGVQISKTNFHADHIKPHTKGGKTDVENGQALCVACNVKKGADD